LEEIASDGSGTKQKAIKCSLCGKPIPQGGKIVNEPGQFIPGSPVNINGIECRFDSEFCDTLFRRLQEVYGAAFCSYLAGTV
jgi:hypothetical protein